MSRLRLIAAAGMLLASLSPLTVHAQGDTPDPATQAALDTFRLNAANDVTSLDNNKSVTPDQILLSYTDGGLAGLGLAADQINTIMVVRVRAEQTAWDELDPAQKDLIRTFWNSSNNVANAQ